MPDQEPDPLKLRSIKLDFEKKRVQIELTDATALRFDFTPQGILAEWLQPPTITTARAVEQLVEPAEAEAVADDKEKTPPVTLTGRLKAQPRPGRPDGNDRPTAWAMLAVHEEGNPTAKMYSTTFHRHTRAIALSLEANARITASGYVHPNEDPDRPNRSDSFRVFNLVDYPGKPAKPS